MTSGFNFLFDRIQLETRSLRSLEKVIFWSITDLEAHNLYANYIVIVPFWYKLTWLITCTLQCNKINLYHSMGKFSRWQIDDIFLLSPENRLWHFLQIVSSGGIKCMILYNCWGALINHFWVTTSENVQHLLLGVYSRCLIRIFPGCILDCIICKVFFMQTTKTLIWVLFGAHVRRYVSWCCDSFSSIKAKLFKT